MWMMGYNDGSDFNSNIQDSFNSRGRIRPVMPRTVGPVPTSTNPPCLFHGGDLVALNHHLAVMTEQNKRDLMNTQQVVVSSRWNPTPEQLQALEELYRQGTRTPSAEQIQHITSELRRYGKIEGKNVFYWFQNHKARERQKRRRQLECSPKEKSQNSKNEEKEESLTGANRTVHEVEQTKYWASPTNSSTFPTEKTTTVSKAVAEEEGSECKSDGWVQFDDQDDPQLLHQQRKNATWQMMNLSCSSSSTSTNTPAIINSSPVTLSTGIPSMSPNMDLIKPPYNLFNIFLQPYDNPETLNETPRTDEEEQTLQLFPLISGGNRFCVNNDDKDEEDDSGLDSTGGNPNYQFFEFLPIKN